MSPLNIKPPERGRTHGAQRRQPLLGPIKAQQSLEVNVNRAVALSHHESFQHRLMLDLCLFSKAYASGTSKMTTPTAGFFPFTALELLLTKIPVPFPIFRANRRTQAYGACHQRESSLLGGFSKNGSQERMEFLRSPSWAGAPSLFLLFRERIKPKVLLHFLQNKSYKDIYLCDFCLTFLCQNPC
jgi:hypothetical protein